MKTRWSLTILVAALCAAGCSSAKPHLSADEYFKQATDNFHRDAHTLAIEQFHELLDEHPFSEYNEEAELRIAQAQYLSGSFAEAVVSLTDFQRRHPTSPHLPFVGYYLGMCYVRQMSTIDRDQTAAQNAQTYFLTVSRQYPDSPFAELAREQLAHCREDLAQHELYIANYYGKRGFNKAAEIRLLGMASHFSDTQASAAGLLQLVELYDAEHQPDHAVLAVDALIRLHPGSAEAVAARQAVSQSKPPADTSVSGDPIDLLLAANGRQRTPGALETVQLPPTAELPHANHRGGGMAPLGGMAPFDPFGRGPTYY